MVQLIQAFQTEIVVSELPQAIRMAAMQLLDSAARVRPHTFCALSHSSWCPHLGIADFPCHAIPFHVKHLCWPVTRVNPHG